VRFIWWLSLTDEVDHTADRRGRFWVWLAVIEAIVIAALVVRLTTAGS
jgi:hypothetical protein